MRRYLGMKDVAAYIRENFPGAERSARTIQSWRVLAPLDMPCAPEEFDAWFQARMEERRRGRSAKR